MSSRTPIVLLLWAQGGKSVSNSDGSKLLLRASYLIPLFTADEIIDYQQQPLKSLQTKQILEFIVLENEPTTEWEIKNKN